MPIPRRLAPAFAPPSVLGLLLVAVGCAQLVGLTGEYVEGAGGAGSGGASSGGGASGQGGQASGAGQGNSSGMAGSMGQAGSESAGTGGTNGAGGTSEAGAGSDAGSGGGEPDTGGASGAAGSSKGGTNNGGSTSGGRGGNAGNGGAAGANAGTGGSSAGTGGGSGVGGSSGGGPMVLTAPFVHHEDCTEGMVTSCAQLPIDCTNISPGANLSPLLSWTPGPDGTQSYAVSLTELYLTRSEFWVIWNLPGSSLMLPQGVAKEPNPDTPAGSQQASLGSMEGYFGPGTGGCGRVYEFKVYALSVSTFSPTTPTDPSAVVDQLVGLSALVGSAVARGRTFDYCDP